MPKYFILRSGNSNFYNIFVRVRHKAGELADRLLLVFSSPKNPSVFGRHCPRDGKGEAEEEGYGVILWGFQEILWDFNVL
jgi:hypothetical protein